MSEWKEVQSLLSNYRIPEEICKVRTEYALKWYIEKANLNKKMFYTFSVAGILCPLLNSIWVACGGCDIILVVLSVIASFATSLLALTNVKSKWENYRSAAEFLKKEYTLFQAKVAVYAEEDRVSIYLSRIENFMEEIHANWRKIFHDQEASKEDREFRKERVVER